MHRSVMLASVIIALSACDTSPSNNTPTHHPSADNAGFTAATEATRQHQQAVRAALDLQQQDDWQQARRGQLASADDFSAHLPSGERIWDRAAYQFISGEAPDSVNPSLWRQAGLNNLSGLFEVVPGIYQLRGMDLANMTLIEGKQGWIVVDPLTSAETAQAAFELAMQHLPQRPISAVLFTHSHIDHFGGINGLFPQFALSNDIPIVAPHGFMHEATIENIVAGSAMSRRASFMYGKQLPRTTRGHIGSGLGKSPAFGHFGIIEPSHSIDDSTEAMIIDGVTFEFQYTPDSEAPAEMTFYLPEYNAFCGAELVSRTQHNLYTLRGAKVRDALKWNGYIEQARQRFSQAHVYFGSHHWPIWGKDAIQQFLIGQRDTYKFIHDQSVRLMNNGATADEIAQQLQLPQSLAQQFSNRGYYGTVKHNAKAVYQFYMGWYNGNPAHLDPIPRVEAASRYVALAGGDEAVLQNAQQAFEQGDYRWAAELLNHLVFAQPGHQEAKQWLARSYDQLGYQAESGPWRDAYLTGAYELRHGASQKNLDLRQMKSVFLHTPVSHFFTSMATRLKAEEADDTNLAVAIHFSDLQQSYRLWIENSVLHHQPIDEANDVDARLTLSHALFIDLLIGNAGIKDVLLSDDIHSDGNHWDLIKFFSLFEKPNQHFAIVTPE
ncbi:alkyl/aryl-sulfatase [Bacterioplanes sanyensis]|nr:alkyl sulfatase dimerization domain-containing protein [Bacterioplanes sanyensis]